MRTGNEKCGRFIPALGIFLFVFLNGAVDLFAGALKIKELGKISAANYWDVFINGNYAYCTDGAGLDILDIRDSAVPKRTGRYESPGTALGVEVKHNYAFIADGYRGLQVVDVSNPANPVRVGNWNSIGAADDYLTSVFVKGNYTYAVSGSSGLLVFDTSTPSNPTLVSTFKYENPCGDDPDCDGIYPSDVFVNFQYAYLVDSTLGLLVVDLTDPTSPQQAAWIDIPANIYEIRVSGNYAYLAAGRYGMQVMDISNPTSPVTAANYYGPENHDTSDVFISGNRAYVSYGDQMDIVDISSPWAPFRTARYNGCLAEKVFARGNYAYVVNGNEVDFTVLDVSDPYSPFQVGELDKPDEPMGIALKNNYAYVPDHQSRLWVIDIGDAAKPVIAGKYVSPDYEYNVAIKGNYAYLTGFPIHFSPPYGGLKVLNISNPIFPSLVGQCTTPSIPTGIFLNGNYAYLSEGESNVLAVMDISIPSAPANVGNYVQTGTDDAARGVFVKGNYAYLAYGDNGLYILDISTPSNPKLTGKYREDGEKVNAVTVRDNYAYLTNYYYGLVVLDVTNPARPKPAGRFEINHGCDTAAVLKGNYAYLLSEDNGIYAIDISDPSSPSLACNYGDFDSLGWGKDLIAGGNKLYAVTSSGFYILEVQPATPTVTLTVQSTPFTGVAVTVAPPDINGKGNGVTGFTRSYTPGTAVTLTAPEYQRKNFSKWMVDGVDRTASRNLEVAMNGNHTARACYEDAAPPVITLNRSRFDFGVKLPSVQEVQTGAQSLAIVNSGEGVLHWSAIPSQSWLQVEPGGGGGNAVVQVSINAAALSQGTYTGDIAVSDPAAANSPQTVKVTLKVFQDTTPPSGSFDTPIDGSVVQGSVPVTGWALDDIGVANVKIYRDGNESLVYIGDALFVEGARPDIEIAFPDYPNSYKAGWGYMLLTHFLPDGGNGTYTLTAKATDMEGNEVTLGSKTITCDNAHAVKPFGAIDTPIAGGTVSGKNFINYGWALTPQPNMIPMDGSTIDVVIDGVVKGRPVYNIFRSDVAALFPGYANCAGAGGYYYLDTTKLKSGLHAIAWIVTDSAGNSDGIGSRYFTVQDFNKSFDQIFSKDRAPRLSYRPPAGINSRRGAPACAPVFDPCAPIFDSYSPASGKIKTVETQELERVEINLSDKGVFEGYLVVGDQLRELPIGSTLDKENGIFYWQPGPGFVGEYRLLFIGEDNDGQFARKNITVNIKPKQ